MKSYQCYAFLCSKNNKAYNDLCVCMGYPRQVGYANGYVAIPHEHPLYGKHYDAPDIYIHGGLTYASSSNELLQLIDSKDLELLDGDLPENY